nr:NAD(P)/FAD-dependent oxidoreductase [uncultured Capnocytophaga sp.]
MYDTIVIGSGLGGLMTALILAKEGRKVAIVEKNKQFGGNLQSFFRDGVLFDTGVHYVGSLEKGQPLHNYFSYAGIISDLDLECMPKDGYDHICFAQEATSYPHAQGYDNFITQLLSYFPQEKAALEQYVARIKEVCNRFPLYRFRLEGSYDESLLSLSLMEFLRELTPNERLQAVLLGNNFLYAGTTAHTPLYVHALSVNSYMESAWRFRRGGSQITQLLVRQLRALGVSLFTENEVLAFEYREGKIYSVITSQHKKYIAKDFVSDIDIQQLLSIAGREHFKPSYYKRIEQLTPISGVFSLHLVLKPHSFPYLPYNIYWFKDPQQVWKAPYCQSDTFPLSYMLSMSPPKDGGTYTDNMTLLTYMDYEQVHTWEHTLNTIAAPEGRGAAYEAFKQEKADQLLRVVYQRYPQLEGAIAHAYTSTPLTYRDYIGTPTGAIYGYEKNIHKIAHTHIMPQTHIPNLYLTGQSVNMHGLLGVTIGAVLTSMAMLGGKIEGLGFKS